MLPENTLSTNAIVGGYTHQVKGINDFLVDWEVGGVYLNDASEGLLVKLWTLRSVLNTETGLSDVTLSAPGGVAPGESDRVLFSRQGITEVALAFDQNMNPFVAYTQDDIPYIYWYDSQLAEMTHTELPEGCKWLKCTLDEKRQFNVQESDIVLAYIRDSNLCVRYQRDRYSIEYILRDELEDYVRLVSMAMSDVNRMQFRLIIDVPYNFNNLVYELDKGWTFDGKYIPHFLELNWLFNENPFVYHEMQKVRIHGLTKGNVDLQVAMSGMQGDISTDYLEDYTEPQFIDLPFTPIHVSEEYKPTTNYTDVVARGIGIQMKFEGRNTNPALPEPAHAIQVLALQSSPPGNGKRAN